ncbi:hypothetical protein D3273_17695 [Lichenibacterium minor]|uniref:DUF5666 domain-containing protein n=1 Tax=Lichenibacterium minor TaxID=2316528 RepID=A0A4Q2U2E3_9HYPH|nr:DUF5666 domain-containing protein [Lichenibacterium minor]RYC30679.1 hypothetical protein D3273_17695 [Lichenibacterium minor]
MSGGRVLALSRRGFAALLLQGAALWGGRALARDPNAGADRGLGGTGATAADPAETLGQDRGIGGTGVIGTIRRFGSIVVNDLRVTFPPGVPVTIDGRPATVRDLKLGHVVQVLARRRGGVLATRAIVARSEVVGPVDAVGEGTIVVLGQRVALPDGVAVPARRAGDHLAVSGLRRLDGTVVASLVERRPAGAEQLHGPVEDGADGGLAVGGLAVADLSPALRGRRVSLVGARRGGVFHASAVTVEPRVPFATADRLSVEAYVARAPDGLRLGSGLDVSAGAEALADVGDGGPVRAVLLARPDGAGRLDARSLRVEREGRGGGAGGLGPGRGEPANPGAPGGPGLKGAGPPDGGRPGGAPAGPHGGGPGMGGPGGVGGGPGGGGAGGNGPGGGGPGGSAGGGRGAGPGR